MKRFLLLILAISLMSPINFNKSIDLIRTVQSKDNLYLSNNWPGKINNNSFINRMPVIFEEDQCLLINNYNFLTRTSRYNTYISATELSLDFKSANSNPETLKIKFLGANQHASFIKAEESGKNNYFIGS